MNTKTKLNIASIIGVKDGIDQIFSSVDENLELYAQNTDENMQLESYWGYIHQLNGLLEMLELSSVTIVSKQVEKLVEALIHRQVKAEPAIFSILKQSTDALRHYLDELIDGEENDPLRLFPVYQKLMQAQGIENISESHLAFPDLTAKPPLQDALLNMGPDEIKTSAKQARSEYQLALLNWLRDTSNKDSLRSMSYAVSLIEKFPGSVRQRSFWWVCSGFLDGLLQQEAAVDLPSRQLCGKIDQEIRRIAQGQPTTSDSLTRDILYQIARSNVNTPLISEIKQAYTWPDYLSTATQKKAPLTEASEQLQANLTKMRAIVVEANENWDEFSNGNKEGLKLLTDNIEALKHLTPEIQYAPLEKLLIVISGTVAYLGIRPQDMTEDVAMEMATALLLIKNMLDSFNKLSPEFPDQVETLSTRLRLITTGKQDENNLPDIPGINETELIVQEKELLQQTAQEILVDLAQVERILDRFLLDSSARSDLPKLHTLFKQISGVLVMLDFERANTLLTFCQQLAEKLTSVSHEIEASEQALLVNGLSSLSFFIEAQKSAQPDKGNILESAIALFEHTENVEPEIAAPEVDPTKPDLSDEQNKETASNKVDPELLKVFLEEADEVLADIATNLQHHQEDQTETNILSLSAIRRGFHTLKGSGRMIKLQDASELAWQIEQVLNLWINERKETSPQLIDLIACAHRTFTEWRTNLKNHDDETINAQELLPLIKELLETEPTDTEPDLDSSSDSDTVTPASSDNDTKVKLGEQIITLDLYEIFIAEAHQHLATLEQNLDCLLAYQETPISNEFMLAAHTLASTSRSLGLTFIATPSFALEQWLSYLLENNRVADAAGLKCAENIIACLGRMLASINLKQLPKEDDLQIAVALSDEMTEILAQQEQNVSSELNTPDTPENASDEQTNSLEVPVEAENNVHPELLQLFLEDAQEVTPEISRKLRAWHTLPQDTNIYRSILRSLHSLKGSAHMAGRIKLGDQIHNMESAIEDAISETVISVSTIEKLEIEFDAIIAGIEQQQELMQADQTIEETTSSTDDLSVDTTAISTSSKENGIPLQKSVRVDTEIIDRLVNESGEISIVHSKVEAQLTNFNQSLTDLSESVDHLRSQLREMEIQAEAQIQSHQTPTKGAEQTLDPLEFDQFTRLQELTRLMAESTDDVMTVQKSLHTSQRIVEETVMQQARMNRQLQQQLMYIRTVPFGNFTECFYRVVRQTARALNKKANLSIQGDEIKVDRSILEKFNSPLEHLLRNAVAHGIESPAERLAAGKSEIGQITITVRQVGNEVVITLTDDGSGLNMTRIREQAEHLKLITADEVLDNDQLMALIFVQGLTTNNEITETSGRGIGMDVVKNEISALRGRIEIESETNKGTTFHIYLPLTLANAQTLLVDAGKAVYAIPTVIVEQAQELDAAALNRAYQDHFVEFNDKIYPFAYLSHLLGESDQKPESRRHNRILLLHSGTLRLAIHVNKLIGNRDIVVKNIGPQLMHAPAVEGATIMGDGEIVFIINPVKLLQRDEAEAIIASPPHLLTTAAPENDHAVANIMVVDDSLTVRKVTSRLLERKGYNVLTAKDGLGAIELLRKIKPNVMLVDLEMPHMNGFELIKNIRDNPDTVKIPIIVISSRTSDKQRKIADDLGVNMFLGKPYNETELISQIAQYVAEGQGDGSDEIL